MIAAVALALLLAACGGGSDDSVTDSRGGDSPAGTEAAPEFSDGLDWLNVERPLSLAELRGKVVVLDFWTYGCINCIHIIPDLERLEAEFPDELVVIGVHSAKFDNEAETESIRSVIARYDLKHPVVNDRDFTVWNEWGIRAWPTTVVIDPAGNVVGAHSGEGVYEVVQPVVEALVAEFDARGSIDRSPIAITRQAPEARVLSFPGKVLHAGSRLFIADTNHHRIVVADPDTGEVLQVLGSGRRGFSDGSAAAARFSAPQGMSFDAMNGILYVADTGNHAVRTIDLATGRVGTLAGTGEQAVAYPPVAGPGAETALSSPWDVLLSGETLYVAMAGSHQIWVVDLATGLAAPFAGSGREGVVSGSRSRAELAQPSGLALDDAGRLFFADAESSSIRFAETWEGGVVALMAGSDAGLFDFGSVDGDRKEARFQHPLGVAFDGDDLFVADTYNSAIRRIDLESEEVTTLAGGGAGWADGEEPLFDEPGGISYGAGRLWVADTNNHAIRSVDPVTGETETLVLYGIEEFAPPPDTEAAEVLDAVVVAPGEVVVVLEVLLPEGYVFNDVAPFTVRWSGEGVAGSFASAGLEVVEPAFPLQTTIELEGGAGYLLAEVGTYYCRKDAQALCLIDRVTLRLPVTVEPGGAGEIAVSRTISDPLSEGP